MVSVCQSRSLHSHLSVLTSEFCFCAETSGIDIRRLSSLIDKALREKGSGHARLDDGSHVDL